MDVRAIDNETLRRIKGLRLPEVPERNQYIVLHIRGDGIRAPEKWNVKMYKNSKGGLKAVSPDLGTLDRLLSGKPLTDKAMTIQVDDSGWGFPLGGVLIGAYDGARVETGLIDVRFFQGKPFGRQEYLEEAACVTQKLLERLGASPASTSVEICTGFVNTRSKEALRKAGYDVRVTEVKGVLQDELERRFKEYVRSLGYRGRMSVQDAMRWVEEKPDERMRMAKTGWKTLSHSG